MTAILDRVKAAFTRKQTEAAQTYAEIVIALANDQTVTEAAILTALEANGKTPDDLDAAVTNEKEANRLSGEVTAAQQHVDDVVIARREQMKITADRDAELQRINDKYAPSLADTEARIRRGEAASMRLGKLQNELSRLVAAK